MKKFDSFHWPRGFLLVVGMLGLGIQQANAANTYTTYTDPNKIVVNFTEAKTVNAVEIQCEPNDVNTNFSVSYGTPTIWKVGSIVTHEVSPGVIKYYIRFERSSGISSDTFTTRIKSPSDVNTRGTRGRFCTFASSDGSVVSDNSGQTYLKRRRIDVPALFKLDFNNAADKVSDNSDANTQSGWTPFTLSYDPLKNLTSPAAYSGSEDVNGQAGVVVELSGDIDSRYRRDPNNKNDPCDPTFDPNHTPILFTKLYRDFIYGIGTPPGGVTMTVWGLGANRDCNIVIYAFDSTGTPARHADWRANGQYIFTADFDGNDPCYWPRTEDAYAWPGTAKADDLGRIILTSSKDPCSSANDSFAFVNGLMVYTTGTYVEPKYAQVPRPAAGQESVPIDTLLKWRKGAGVIKHDLYFGTDFNDVNNACRTNLTGIEIYQPDIDADANTFDPYGAGTLELSKTYYWRIDENDTSNLWKGQVWSFTTESAFARNPSPASGTTGISTNVALSWSPGPYAVSHDVYLGTDESKVTDANRSNPMGVLVSQDQLTTIYAPPELLDSHTTYYWRIDEVNPPPDSTIFKGGLWSFMTYEPAQIWRVDERCFLNGPPGSFDSVSVKDPSIVYSGGKWHLFYTGKDSSNWRMGYATATTIAGLKDATHTFMSSLNGDGYFCAPQVFWFEAKGKWYLIYQSGLGATFSTNTDINNPGGWTAESSMGFSAPGAVDFWCISDGNNVYIFYSPQDSTYVIKRRSTTVADFPYNWSDASNVCSNTFEAPHVYKNIADGKFYMMVEDITRHFELWTADNPGGTWTQLAENWAEKSKLVFNADAWTDQVSHGEIIRAGTNERMEINNIDRCQILIQGVVGSYPDYGSIPYNLGIIRECLTGTADIDCDYDVDFVDFAFLASQWLQTPGVPSADIAPPDGDGIVDMQDLGFLADNWLLGI